MGGRASKAVKEALLKYEIDQETPIDKDAGMVLWKKFDADKSGNLTSDELRKFAEAYCTAHLFGGDKGRAKREKVAMDAMCDMFVQNLMSRFDKDHDGTISQAEFFNEA